MPSVTVNGSVMHYLEKGSGRALVLLHAFPVDCRVWGNQVTALSDGTVLLCDRYRASSVAYGEAQGLDARWLESVQVPLPAPDLTILLDMAPEVSLERKQTGRDKYEQDLDLLERVRRSYLRQAKEGQWTVLDAVRDRAIVADDVRAAVAPLIAGAAS